MPYVNSFPCAVNECERDRRSKLYCGNHLKKYKKYGDPLGGPGSGKKVQHTHCTVKDCGKKHIAQGLCQMHYRRNTLYGDPNTVVGVQRSGVGYIARNGYIELYAPEHPNAKVGGYIAEHRKIMSDYLGRPLTGDENVHHKNGNRTDNRLENLELWSVSQPAGQRVEDKVKYALEILERYAPELLGSN